jgi:fumarate reductase flavoprotein subunit
MSDKDFDVVVVGAGGAGLAAAVTAADEGAAVVVVEVSDRVGGATALAGGSFMAAGTPQQAAAGYPDDSVEEFFDYYMTFNRWDADPSVARRFCEAAAPTMQWLVELGVTFEPENIYRAGLERSPRSHRPTGGGLAIVEALHRACRTRSIDFAFGNRVEQLVVENGRVAGVVSRGEELTAEAVIVTTGGFGSNPDLVRAHYPNSKKGGPDVWSPAPDTNVGDGLRIGVAAGAGTAGSNHGELLLSPGFSHELEPIVPGWLVFVNQAGRRFVNELAPHTVVTPLMLSQGDSCWAVFDDAALRSAKASSDPRWGAGSWVSDTLLAERERGRVLTAADVPALAAAMHVPPDALDATVQRYTADTASGCDTQFFKDAAVMKPISQPPFYAVEMRPSVVAVTGYGLRIDPDARVLRETDGRPLHGLYAAGEVTGNVIGAQYIGGGNAIGSALIFGRIAGRTAVTDQRQKTGARTVHIARSR